MKRSKIVNLLYLTLIPMMLYLIVEMLTPDYETYFYLIKKPVLTLPLIGFLIMWLLYFLLLGVSTYIALNQTTRNEETTPMSNKIIKYYYYLIIAGLLTTPFFYIFKWRIGNVLWSIGFLILLIFAFRNYYKVNKLSGYLLIPHILIGLYLLYFSISVVILNMCECGFFCNCLSCS